MGLSWNFKVFQWINLNESFRRDLKKILSSRFGDIPESAKCPNSEWGCTYTGGEKTG